MEDVKTDVIDVQFEKVNQDEAEATPEVTPEDTEFEAKLAFLKLPVVLHYFFSNKTTQKEEEFKLQELSRDLQEICDTEKIRFALQNLNMAISEEIQKRDEDIKGVLAIPALLPEVDDQINAQSQKFFENLLEYNYKLMQKAQNSQAI